MNKRAPLISKLAFEESKAKFSMENIFLKFCNKYSLTINNQQEYSNSIVNKKPKIFLLFNKLSINEKIIYDAIVKSIGEKMDIDINSYNNDYFIFKNLLKQKENKYTHYIINPPVTNEIQEFQSLIEQIPKEKLIIVGKKTEKISGDYGAVFENFEEDIFKVLETVKQKIEKYNKLTLIFSSQKQPLEMKEGFVNFCVKHHFNYEIISDFDSKKIDSGNFYITPEDSHLIKLVEQSKKQKLVSGKDFGIISYNETPLKEIILKGLTTISSDFEQMGKTIAQLILDSSKEHIYNPFKLTIRDSI